MTDQFLAEIRIFTGTFVPYRWALCDGSLMPISQNTALYSLLGTSYGGNGQTTFALPDLRGATPVGQGQGPGLSQYVVGQSAGTEAVTLTTDEMPQHTHTARAYAGRGTANSSANAIWATGGLGRLLDKSYGSTSDVQFSSQALAAAGSGQPHDNRQPYLTMRFIIALQGIFPPRP